MSYDQWKTASPYDDDPDVIEEAEKFLKEHEGNQDMDIRWAMTIIQYLLDDLEEADLI